MFTKIIIGLIILLFLGFFLFINSAPKLPADSEKIIAKVLTADLPELVKGETGIAKSGDIEIWYEKINATGASKGTVLLIMGHMSSALVWRDKFYQPLVDSGYQIIRYDNRDVGLSTWIENWDKNNPYTLEDMTKDGLAVLDAAKVEKAHLIGASMGGMIAQNIAINHGHRVLSLTSIMSSGYMMDPEIVPVPKSYSNNFIKLAVKYLMIPSESNTIKFYLGFHQLLKGNGPYELEVKEISEVASYEIRKRNGFNKKAIQQQAMVVELSGSRLPDMGNIKVPTLVIHGKSDPLINFDHAEKYAPLIPNADILFIDGMGHDIPSIYLNQVHEAIFKTISKTN